MLRRTFGEMCETFGVDATVAASGAEAIKLLEQRDFDLILSDVEMDEINGVQLLVELRNRRIATPVILVSGQISKRLNRDLRRASVSADLVISKPVGGAYYAQLFSDYAKKLGRTLERADKRPV